MIFFVRKYLFHILILAIVGFLFFRIKNSFNEEVESVKIPTSYLEQSELSNQEAAVLADRLADSFSGSFLGFGTDEKLIKQIVSSINSFDFAKVNHVFGLRHYDGSQVNHDKLFGFLPASLSKPRSLAYILDKELGSGSLRSLISNMYQNIGIPFTP